MAVIKNKDGSLTIGEIVDKEESFMNPPVIDEEAKEVELEEEKPKKGGRPKKN